MEGMIYTSCCFRVIATGLIFLISIKTSFAGCADTTVGVENKYIIPDSSFTASSYYDNRYSPYQARLNGNLYGWGPRTSTDSNDYLQIDLGLLYVICAVATQGNSRGSEWVKQYKISLSMDNINWTHYQENEPLKVFAGNTDSRTIVKNTLTQPLARYIRFIPITYKSWKTIRVGIFGYLKACVNVPLGMASEAIQDGSITATSAQHPAKNARLHYTSGSSWCASTSDSNPHLQIDLGASHLICAVATQGNIMADQWVKTYQINTSTDGSSWTTYQENNIDRIFHGNYDRSTVVRGRLYHGFITRYLRFVPKTYQTSTPCLRTEIYGYPFQTSCSGHSVGIPSTSLVRDHRFTATSFTGVYSPSKGRLGASTAWAPSTKNDANDYYQVDLGGMFHICVVATQGSGESSRNQWVKKYELSYSNNNVQWTTYHNKSGEKEFSGNNDRTTIVANAIDNPLKARFVRVRPTEYQEWKMLRVDFKGLPLGCIASLGLENSQIPDSKITAYSHLRAYPPPFGRLYGSSSWCSSTVANTEFIQVDLGQIKTVTGIATQGSTAVDAWVTSYKVSYSFDNTTWNEYKEGQVVKNLEGNTNTSGVRVNWLGHPIAARYVRITPQTHKSGKCLRFDLYGCDVYVVPKVILDTADLILPSIKGSSQTLTCSVLGEPTPDIQWFNNGTKINGATQSTLQVQFISAEDVMSKYSCTRQDPNTRAVVCNTFYKCKIVNPSHLPSGGIKETTAAKVTIFLNVPKAPNVTAQPNKKSVTLSWTTMTASDDVGTITSYTIQLHKQTSIETYTVQHPASNYTIKYSTPYSIRMNAISTVGQGLWSSWLNATTLIDDIVPTKYSNSTIWALEGNDVTLSCYTSGDEPIKYTWRKSGSLSLDRSVAKARGDDLVVRLQSDRDFGTYICDASNSEETIVYRINRVQVKKYMTQNPDTCKRSESKAMEVVPYVIPLALIIFGLIICIVYLVYRLRKQKQHIENIMEKIKSKSDERGIRNGDMDNSDHPVDVIKNSRKPETAKADEIETPGYMELKPRQSSDRIYQSIQEPENRPTKSETPHTQGTTGHEQYMDLKPRANTEYETLHHKKNAEQDYEDVGQGL